MGESRRRKAANEAVFREVNERIEGLQRDFAATHDQQLLLVCECDRIECTERLSVSPEIYERVRGNAACFFVLLGHEDPSVEDVVDTGGDYLIVRKRPGEARDLAVETDPRS